MKLLLFTIMVVLLVAGCGGVSGVVDVSEQPGETEVEGETEMVMDERLVFSEAEDTAKKLYDEFVADAETARAYRVGSEVEVKGEVVECWQSIFYLVGWPNGGVECDFGDVVLVGFEVGDVVVVRGKLVSYDNGWVRLKGCVIVE